MMQSCLPAYESRYLFGGHRATRNLRTYRTGINSPKEVFMSGEMKTTTNHDEIRQWAEGRGGRPARIHNTFGASPDASVLQIDFLHDKYDDDVEAISWDEFFALFDREDMVLVYQTETEGGKQSCFGRIVRRQNVPQAVIE
jgi:hypothetical protein